VVAVAPVLDRVGAFATFLDEDADRPAIEALRLARSTGRPVGAADWIARLEADTRRAPARQKRGPKPGRVRWTIRAGYSYNVGVTQGRRSGGRREQRNALFHCAAHA
jgi:hypothetical protein